MNKYLLVMMSIIITAELSAKTYFSEEDQAAVIYIMDGPDGINALYCEDVSKVEARNIMKAEKIKSGSFDQNKCSKISSSPITKATLEKNVPKIKKQYIEALSSPLTMMKNMTKGFSGDENTGNDVENLFNTLTEQQKVQVESIDAEMIFSKLLSEAKVPFVKAVNSKELEEEYTAIAEADLE